MNKNLIGSSPITTHLFLEDVIEGLSQPKKVLPWKYFYDEIGAYYFERICKTQEYYVTRTEIAIMKEFASEIGQIAGPNCLVLEYGSGATSTKTRLLLDHLEKPAGYIPIDLFPDYLEETANTFSVLYPQLEIMPLCADFTQPFELPSTQEFYERKLIYFPGSTIGNFSNSDALSLMQQMRLLCDEGDLIILGVDLKKSKYILNCAYNDLSGFTAAFNLNLLHRINFELGADFNVEHFKHKAFYNEKESCVEMHLISQYKQMVTIKGCNFFFHEGENIHTESSYKYDLPELGKLSRGAGFQMQCMWMDQDEYFGVVLLEANEDSPNPRLLR